MRFFIPLLSLLVVASARADNAPLDAWLKRQVSITTLDARFTQERKLPALKNPTYNQHIGGMAIGPEFDAKAGQTYPIEILIGEIPGGSFGVSLLINQRKLSQKFH